MLKKNHLLCVDLVVYLQEDTYPEEGKLYVGTLRNQASKHGPCGEKIVFFESSEKKVTTTRRNPVIFAGGCFNVHQLSDGRPRLEVCHPHFYPDFSFADFCIAGAQELLTIAELFKEKKG